MSQFRSKRLDSRFLETYAPTQPGGFWPVLDGRDAHILEWLALSRQHFMRANGRLTRIQHSLLVPN